MIRLPDILATTREDVDKRRRERPLDCSSLEGVPFAPRGFEARLRESTTPSIIAEIKRRSPSRGAIRPDLNPASVARTYQRAGAKALSVLTDGPYFGGSFEDLRAAREAVSLPVIRKDFIVDAYQVWETVLLGADALLLIVAALEESHFAELYALSRDVGLDVLVEVHDQEELDVAARHGATLIGVNNRNLKTMKVDLATSIELAEKMPSSALSVCESGLSSPEDVRRAWDEGYRAFLIGQALGESDETEALLASLAGAIR